MKVKQANNGWRNSASPGQTSGVAFYSDYNRDTNVDSSLREELASSARLLTDYFHIELSSGERRLLQVLAMYRRAIPLTHRGMLEHHLSAGGAWAGLARRDLLSTDKRPWHETLQSGLQSWLCSAVFTHERQQVRAFHGVIASCCLEELGSRNNTTTNRRTTACEALYHLTSAGDEQRLQQIPPELLSTELKWALTRLKNFYDDLYRSNAPVTRQRCLLQYRTLLEPDNHAVHRFLGQCWQKEEGKGSRKAIDCLETACRLMPHFPPYLADLGQALLATGRAGASEFLVRLKSVEKECPAAINDYVRSIRLACMKLTSGSGGAVVTRQDEISSGSRNPVLYADEARSLLKMGNYAKALETIELAEQRLCGTDITTAIKCLALEKAGKRVEASLLRCEKIALGSRNPALYCDEARAQLAIGDPEGALAIIDLAFKNNIVNDYLVSVRATALQRAGKSEQATAVRMAKIAARSRNCVFYNDEAKARMIAGDFKGAKELLELAVQYNCANQVTSVLWSKVLRLEEKSVGNDDGEVYKK